VLATLKDVESKTYRPSRQDSACRASRTSQFPSPRIGKAGGGDTATIKKISPRRCYRRGGACDHTNEGRCVGWRTAASRKSTSRGCVSQSSARRSISPRSDSRRGVHEPDYLGKGREAMVRSWRDAKATISERDIPKPAVRLHWQFIRTRAPRRERCRRDAAVLVTLKGGLRTWSRAGNLWLRGLRRRSRA